MHFQTLAVSALVVRSCLGSGGRILRVQHRDQPVVNSTNASPGASSSYTSRRYTYSPLLNATSSGPTATEVLVAKLSSSSSSSASPSPASPPPASPSPALPSPGSSSSASPSSTLPSPGSPSPALLSPGSSSSTSPTPALASPGSSSSASPSPGSSSSASPSLGSSSAASPSPALLSPGSSSSASPSLGSSSSASPSSNGTCGRPTLNVLSASLDWWYSQVLYYAVSTFSLQYNANHSQTGWTLLPASTTFDLSSALATDTCTSTLSFYTYYNTSLYDISCFPAPTPVAAETIIITQTAYSNPSANTGTGAIPNVVVTPAPASIPIYDYTGTFYQGTPFVYFSTYEIVSKSPTTYGNGSVGCAETTDAYPMATPFGFAYSGPDVNGSQVVGAGVTGDVAPAFLEVVSVSAVAGSWVAAPTVAIVMQEIFAAEAFAAAPLFRTQSLLTPTATLPPGISTGLLTNTNEHISTVGGHTETTATSLDVPTQKHPVQTTPLPRTSPHPKTTPLPPPSPQPKTTPLPSPSPQPKTTPLPHTTPQQQTTPRQNTPPPKHSEGQDTTAAFVASHGNTKITLAIPVNPTQTVVTAVFSEGTVTATRVKGGNPAHGVPAAVSPTNALDVLSQAEETFDSSNPTAVAVVHGLGPFSTTADPASKNVPVIIVDGTTFTADSSTQFKLGKSKTLTPGGTAVVDGTTLSLLPDATAVVIDGHTQAFSASTITAAPQLTIGAHVYTASNGLTYVIDGKTLTPGGVITVDRTTISLGPGASIVVVNGLTQNIGPNASSATVTSPPALTIGGHTYTAINSGATYVINGETLTPGEEETVTIHGTKYIVSLAPGGTILKIETEGSNGQAISTTFETLNANAGGHTSTDTVHAGAHTRSKSSSGPMKTHGSAPTMKASAACLSLQTSTILITFSSLVMALWR